MYKGHNTQVDLVNIGPTGFPKLAQVDIVLDPFLVHFIDLK